MSEEAEALNETSNAGPITFDKVVDERGVPLGNVLKEVTRKLGRMNEMNAKLDLLLQTTTPSTQLPDEGAEVARGVDSKTKSYIDSRFEKAQYAEVEKAQKLSIDQVFKTFPELSKSSDDFDPEFLDLATNYESNMNPKDPERPMKAAKLAALDLGKIERITKARVIQDEARRTRMISEGSLPSKESTKQTGPKLTINKKNIEKWFKIDAAKVEKFAKEEE